MARNNNNNNNPLERIFKNIFNRNLNVLNDERSNNNNNNNRNHTSRRRNNNFNIFDGFGGFENEHTTRSRMRDNECRNFDDFSYGNHGFHHDYFKKKRKNVTCSNCKSFAPRDKINDNNNCSHMFCLNCCLKLYNSHPNADVTCPIVGCEKKINQDNVYSYLEKQKKNDRFNVIIIDPCKFCKQETNVEEKKFKICQGCHRSWCMLCEGDMHKGFDCLNYARIKQAPNYEKLAKEAGIEIKRCPKCSRLHEKDDSDYIVCYECKTCFCWHCLDIINKENVKENFKKHQKEKLCYGNNGENNDNDNDNNGDSDDDFSENLGNLNDYSESYEYENSDSIETESTESDLSI